ncbi:hypothetical protein IWQ62_001618 [Dispira parvispora]|uniref:MINDY deubiquitinase domain-containing protein n=1 Tax=Dispira parvispora TaxID=1520584 RepID=A0A9W8E8V4_9FUNG|nr:hypothetical protein IWQ62_001618 [Dispira parvispora]
MPMADQTGKSLPAAEAVSSFGPAETIRRTSLENTVSSGAAQPDIPQVETPNPAPTNISSPSHAARKPGSRTPSVHNVKETDSPPAETADVTPPSLESPQSDLSPRETLSVPLTTSSTSLSQSSQPATAEGVYQLKDIVWIDPATQQERQVKVITQNENGPCPLIAICNVLLLRGEINLPAEKPTVTFDHLVQLLADKIVRESDISTNRTGQEDADPTSSPDDRVATMLNLLSRLAHGLDVNIRFYSIQGFEPTAELSLFVALGVPLVHGWLPDPQSEFELWDCLVTRYGSYNSAVECVVRKNESLDQKSAEIGASGAEVESQLSTKSQDLTRAEVAEITQKVSASPVLHDRNNKETVTSNTDLDSVIHDGFMIEQFLQSTATQLTYHGLITLSTELPDHQLCVLFRNNHFSTLYKRSDGELYLLVTDSGLVNNKHVVWESLRDIDQEGSQFYTHRFQLPKESDSSDGVPENSGGTPHTKSPTVSPEVAKQMDDDYTLALLLQEQDRLDNAERAQRHHSQGSASRSQRQSAHLSPSAIPANVSGRSSRERPPHRLQAKEPNPLNKPDNHKCVIF